MIDSTNKQSKCLIPEDDTSFDYAILDRKIARGVRVSTEKIRHLVKRNVDHIIEIGTELIAVKRALPHGQFCAWLHAEFGWKERTARNFMNVARQFKSAIIADLDLSPTAAFLLAAPSTPERARTVAIERAKRGERITVAVAEKIIAKFKDAKKNGHEPSTTSITRKQTIETLDRLKQQWPDEKAEDLAQLLREFADSLAKPS